MSGLWEYIPSTLPAYSVKDYIGSVGHKQLTENTSSDLTNSIHTLKSGEKLSAEVEMESDDTTEADFECTEFSEWEVEALRNKKHSILKKGGLLKTTFRNFNYNAII